MKYLAIVLIICTVINVKKIFGFPKEHNSLNRENARECNTIYITTNVNITGGNTIINFGERKKHPNCPENDDPKNPTYLPYPGDCGKFYKCCAGFAYPVNCPAGLHWSIEANICDYPEVANCDPNATTTIRTTSEKTKEPTQPTERTTPNIEEPIINHPNCLVDDDPMHPTYLPYPGNCSKYYKCCAGDAYPMDCPACLHWSIELERCVYPNIANCDPNATTTIRTTTELTKEPTQTTERTTTTIRTTIEPTTEPTQPTERTTTTIRTTSEPTTEPTQPTERTTTTIRTTSEPTTESTQPTERTTPNIEEPIINHPNCLVDDDPMHPTYLPYPGNCSKYYKCCAGDAYPMDCPACLHWSIELERCVYPNIANCDPNATTTIRTTTELTKEPTQTTERTTTTIRTTIEPTTEPTQPTERTTTTIRTTSEPTTEPTQPTERTTTTIRTTSEPTTEPTQPTERTTPNIEEPIINHPNCLVDDDPMHPTYLPYPGNCSKYYKCCAGDAYPMDCPACLHWSIELERCVYPNIANCDPNATTTIRTTSELTKEPTQTTERTTTTIRTTIEPTKESTQQTERTTPNIEEPIINHPNCPEHDDPMHPTYLPYPGNCSKYYKCCAGDAYPMDCPVCLHWSIELERCVYPNVAKCDPNATTTIRTTSEATTQSTERTTPYDEDKAFRYEPCPLYNNPELEKTYKTYFPFPKKCNKYLKCSYGFAVPTYCPPGLHWSTKYSRCDYPHLAHCVQEI